MTASQNFLQTPRSGFDSHMLRNPRVPSPIECVPLRIERTEGTLAASKRNSAMRRLVHATDAIILVNNVLVLVTFLFAVAAISVVLILSVSVF